MRSKMNSLPSYGLEFEALIDNGVPHPSRWQVWGGEWGPVAVEEEEEGQTQKKQREVEERDRSCVPCFSFLVFSNKFQ